MDGSEGVVGFGFGVVRNGLDRSRCWQDVVADKMCHHGDAAADALRYTTNLDELMSLLNQEAFSPKGFDDVHMPKILA